MVCQQSGFVSNRFNLAYLQMHPCHASPVQSYSTNNTALGIRTDEKHPMHKILTASQTIVFYDTTG